MKNDLDELILLNLLTGSLHIVRDGGDGFNVSSLATPATEKEIMQAISKKRCSLRHLINKTRLGYMQSVLKTTTTPASESIAKSAGAERVDESDFFYHTPRPRGGRNRNISTNP